MFSGSQEIRGSEVVFRVCEDLPYNRYELAKLIFDRVFAIFLLALLSPVVLFALVLVRLTSRGSTIYTQRHVGQFGQHFTIYKIRSMYIDSEINGPRWSLPGDKRVTPIGRFLRWSHIDELPQLINVVRGEMSLIGPRPERPELIEQLEHALPHYHYRHKIRPGITGMVPGDSGAGHGSRKRSSQIELRRLLRGSDEFLAQRANLARDGFASFSTFRCIHREPHAVPLSNNQSLNQRSRSETSGILSVTMRPREPLMFTRAYLLAGCIGKPMIGEFTKTVFAGGRKGRRGLQTLQTIVIFCCSRLEFVLFSAWSPDSL